MVGRGLCRGAVLQLVLPHHRLWRHDRRWRTPRPAQVLGRTLTIRFDSNVTPRTAVEIRARSRTRSRCASARWRPSTTRSINHGRARDRRAGRLQRLAADGRRLFHQDQLLLLHRADHEAGRDARDDGGVLCRSGDRQGSATRTSLNTITLSYTFYRLREPAQPVARARDNATSFNGDTGAPSAARTGTETTMADAHAKHHDYHLVDPSPWPAVGAISAFITGGRRHQLDAPHVSPRRRWCSASASSACSTRSSAGGAT